jgi:hypothetical protein
MKNGSMILKTLGKRLNLAFHADSLNNRSKALRSLRHGQPRHMGEYTDRRGELNITRWGDVQTAAHEVFHALVDRHPRLAAIFDEATDASRVLRGFTPEQIRDIRRQTRQVSYDADNPHEGGAELFRVWMTQEKTGHDVVPDAMRGLTAALKRELSRSDFRALVKAKDQMHQLLSESVQDTYFADIQRSPNPGRAQYWNAKDASRQFLVDKFHPFRKMEQVLYGEPLPDGSWEGSHRLAGKSEIVDGLIRGGKYVDPVDGKVKRGGVLTYDPMSGEFGWKGKALRAILEPVAWSKAEMKRFLTYARMRMGKELYPQRIGRDGVVRAPEDFPGLDPKKTVSEYQKEMQAVRTEERVEFKSLDVERKLKKLKRLQRKYEKSDDQDLILDKIMELEESIRPWMEANEALDLAKDAYRKAQIREDWRSGKSREQKYIPEQMDKGMETESETFRKVFDELKTWHEGHLDFLEATGVLAPESRLAFRRIDYAFGLFKQIAESGRGGAAAEVFEGGSGIRTHRGSSRHEMDPMEALVYGPSMQIQLGLENLVKQKLVKNLMAPGGGAYGQVAKAKMEKRRVSTEAAMRLIENLAQEMPKADYERIKESGLMEHMRDSSEYIHDWVGGKKPNGPNIMTVHYNGKPEYFQLTEPTLVDAVASFRPYSLKGLAKIMSKMTTLYQGSIVMHPEFALMSNFPRDLLYSTIGTRTGLQHISAAANGLMHSIRESPLYWEYVANGGGHATRYGSPVDREKAVRAFAARHNIKNLVMNPRELMTLLGRVEGGDPHAMAGWRWMPRVQSDVFRPLQAGKWFGRHFEAAAKLGEYARAKRQGETKTHATFLGREVSTDFGVHGHNQPVAAWVRAMPFVSAMINGNDNFMRKIVSVEHGGRGRRAAIWAKSATYAMLSASTALFYRDAEWYQKMPEWKKLAYDMFPVAWDEDGNPTEIATIPKAFEPGMLANQTRIALEAMLDDGTRPERDHARNALHGAWINFQIGLPPMAQMAAEQASNTRFLTGAPIEDEGMKRQPSAERSSPNTAQIFKDWGQLWEEHLDMPHNPLASPARAQAAFLAMTGTMGWQALYMAEGMNDEGRAPFWDEHPFVRRLLQRADKYDTDYGLMWESAGRMQRNWSGMMDAFRADDDEKAERYLGRGAVLSPIFEGTIGAVNVMRQERDAILSGERDDTLPGTGTIKERRRDAAEKITREIRELSEIPLESYRDQLRSEE